MHACIFNSGVTCAHISMRVVTLRFFNTESHLELHSGTQASARIIMSNKEFRMGVYRIMSSYHSTQQRLLRNSQRKPSRTNGSLMSQ
eukprot:1159511-Pelagomonas_calceolata.AAC.2